jgi:superfamily II DNA or RNA helicase
MLKCEQQPLITYLTDLKYVPFLDTGLYFDPQNLSRFFQKRELKHGQSECRAGVLASQIGSGKTASMITLIQQSCQGQTLVVVPDSILYQWKSEFEKFSQLKVLMVDKAQDKGPFEQYQVILTTRSILSTQKSPIKDYIL